MTEKPRVELDRSQVKKAVQALQAFLKSKSASKKLFTDESQKISLLFTLWKIPKQEQTIRIPLPHSQRIDSEDVCLFTRDEPQMTAEQTVRFYKKLLEERGVKKVTEVIPFKVLKTEYKPFEAKRRLLGNFDMFLADERIRRRLPSHLGKHFYERKREPLAVNLLSKNLARDIQKVVQGTSLKVNNKGSCCMVRVGHSGMTADDLTENIEAAVQTVVEKIRMKGPVMKIIHIKSEKSVALPIYTSDLSHLVKVKRSSPGETPKGTEQTSEKKRKVEEEEKDKEDDNKKEEKEDEADEDIPQLVPIETNVEKMKQQQKKIRPVDKKPARILPKTMKKSVRATKSSRKAKAPKMK